MYITQQTARHSRSPWCGRFQPVIAIGLCLATLIAAGCDRTIPPGPTGQPILPWKDPFDRDALLAAMPSHRSGDLSSYNFVLLLVVQNYLESGFAFTIEVNGQTIDRPYVGGLTQEIVAITEAMVQQTEAPLGLSSALTDRRLSGACPYIVRLKDYVTEDGYMIQNSNFVLAPVDMFESKTFNDILDPSFYVDAHHVCPGAFAIAVKKTHVDFIELDREFVPVNEGSIAGDVVDSGDNDDVVFERGYTGLTYHAETIDALDQLGMAWLLPHSHQPPFVRIVSPASGEAFTAGANVTLVADAYDPDGLITNVTFYADDQWIGEDALAPYSVTWQNALAGSYDITAVATDNEAMVTTSDAITINVGSTLEVFPTSLTFAATESTATVNVSNSGTGTLTVTEIVPTKPWISVTPTSGGEGQYTIVVSRTGLAAGSYTGSVLFVSDGGSEAVSVSLTVE